MIQEFEEVIAAAQEERRVLEAEERQFAEHWGEERKRLSLEILEPLAKAFLNAGIPAVVERANGGILLSAGREMSHRITVDVQGTTRRLVWHENGEPDEYMRLPLNLAWWEHRAKSFARRVALTDGRDGVPF